MLKIMITPEAYAAIVGKLPRRDQLDHTGRVGLWLSNTVARDLRRERRSSEDYSACIIRMADMVKGAPV